MMTAFIGLGNMGLPMAINLVKRHASVVCFDISSAARTAGKKAGLPIADNAGDLAAQADVIITMLPAGAHVHAFYGGAHGALKRLRTGALLIDCSTTAPEDARTMAAAAKSAGLRFVDAPVSGGIGGARAASLSFLAGGSAADVRRARPLLSAMGANIFHAGKVGDGQAAKICNNMMLSVQMVGACEALALGRKMGLDGEALSNIMRASSGGNWVVEKYNPLPGVMPNAPASNDYRGGFMVDLMLKDSDLALAAANHAGAAAPMAATANQIYRLHQNDGNGGLDFSSVIKMFEKTSKSDEQKSRKTAAAKTRAGVRQKAPAKR